MLSPGGENHVRPFLPLPASCSSAITMVPSAAPLAASSFARVLVESVMSKQMISFFPKTSVPSPSRISSARRRSDTFVSM